MTYRKIRPLQTGDPMVDSRGAALPAFARLWQQLFGNGDTTNATADAALTGLDGKQDLDADLTAVSALTGTGIAVRTAADTWALRTLTQPAAGLSITNPAGTAGNPVFALTNDLAALEALSGTHTIYYRSATDTWSPVTISTGLDFTGAVLSATGTGATTANALTISNSGSGAASGSTFNGSAALTISYNTIGAQPLDATLTALAAYNTNGILVQTAADTFTGRTITVTSGHLTVSNGDGVSGNPVLALPSSGVTAGSYTSADITVDAQGRVTAAANGAGGGGGSGTVTSVSVVTANGVSGSVATSTTTPAITLTLGAITPTSVAASGTVTGSNLSGTNTGDQTITLTGNVTGSGTGSFATTIAAGVVTLAMQANMATASVVYRKTAGSGAPEVNTLATLKTDLGLTGTNGGDQTITLTGDVTGSGTGSFSATIANDAVTNAKAANMATATFKGRVTAGTGDPEDLTGTQATTLLDAFTSSLKGLAPSSGGGTTNYLRADGTWAAPPGSGGSGTVTTSGSPASGNLAKFSGSTAITNGDLSGDVTTSGTLATTLAASGVAAATYGNSTHVAQITIDAKGRVTNASSVAVSGAVPANLGLIQAISVGQLLP